MLRDRKGAINKNEEIFSELYCHYSSDDISYRL